MKKSYTMGKTEINDEIVRMRKLVRQAKVCIIHKLIREAKTLRTKNGTEKQQEKNKKKADKLINEIYFLKKIKDDRITKFGITNTKSLQEILQNKKSKTTTRIMAKVVDYKSLKNAIIQFRNTYSDYEHLQPGQSKSTKQNKKPEQEKESKTTTKRETRASTRITESSLANESNSDDEDNNNIGIETEDNNHSEEEQNSEQNDLETGSILRIKPMICKQTKSKENKRLKRDRKESTEFTEECNDKYDNEDVKKIKKAEIKEISHNDKEQDTVKVISKQATVKRFTEILQEQSSEENGSSNINNEKVPIENKSESEKKIDSFFVSGDGDAYLSLASSTTKENNYLSEDEDNNYYNKKSKEYIDKRTFSNDRFFSNIKSSEAIKGKGREKESRHNFNRDKNLFKKQKNNNESSFKDTKKRNNVMNENSNENKNLHPSWAAKKKQQEIIKQGFQGKKIIFDNE
ncbi:serum response factor-binding protein 1-like [Vespa mandarinia]|uniref:serum response factor-binding protein 1-like n=1 Tax=Vespa mandarinia TaxID=7446 RepID=UPI0016143BC4|nr:serum response factor-binding protein 1-like [Vespa mandarinia]